MQHVLVESDTDVGSPIFVNGEEVATDCDADPTVTVVRLDGTTITPDPTVAAIGELGRYTAALTAADHADLVDVLTLTWAGDVASKAQRLTDTVEVVGAHVASLAELRDAVGAGGANLTPDRLRFLREGFYRMAETYLGVPIVPSARKVISRTNSFQLPAYTTSVRSLTVDSVIVTVDEYEFNDQYWWLHLFELEVDATATAIVECGLDGQDPNIKTACLEFVRYWSFNGPESGTPRNATTWSDQAGNTFRLSTADWKARRPTGIQTVDDHLNMVPSERIPGMG